MPSRGVIAALFLILLCLARVSLKVDDLKEDLAVSKGEVEKLKVVADKAKGDLVELTDRLSASESTVAATAASVNVIQASYLPATYRRIPLNKSGSETCDENGETCLGVRPIGVQEYTTKEFWGYRTYTCNSRVKARPGCVPGSDFSMTGSEFRRSPTSKVPEGGDAGDYGCLRSPWYDFAVCMKLPDRDGIKR